MKGRHPSLRRLVDIIDDLLDERTGIVRQLSELPREAGAPDFFHFYALACSTGAFCKQDNFASTGGASTDRGVAIAKALGEAVERYSSAIFEVEELPLFSRREAPFPCVEPARFALYSAAQYDTPGFPYVPFDDETPIRWTKTTRLRDGATIYVPAAMVYVPYYFYAGTGDSPICQPISTGLAAHCSLSEAIISGTCETIERDAVMITWQARLGPPHLRVETLSDANYELVQRFERTLGRVTLLDLSLDLGVPTVLATLRSAAPAAPALVVAASTSLDREEAVRKSLEELAHTRRYSQQIKSLLPRVVVDLPLHENITGQIGHLNFWCDHENAREVDFLFTSKKRVEFDELPNPTTGSPKGDVSVLSDKIEAVGHDVLVAELTTPDVGELGMSVVHCLIPGFHPLFLGHPVRALGGERLYAVPQKLGYAGIERESGGNPVPHPYP